ncbi:MAG: hypothetical protein ABF242_03445 [Flavobacteriales bacterium]
MTDYQKNGDLLGGEEQFISTAINIKEPLYNVSDMLGYRNTDPCRASAPVFIDYVGTSLYFKESGTCDTLNRIDPFYYKSPGSPYSGISGRWDFEYKNKRMFILSNKNQTKEAEIRITFEKRK